MRISELTKGKWLTDNSRRHTPYWWYILILIVVFAAIPRLLSYRYGLPYAEDVNEPAFYLAGQQWRGLYKIPDYFSSYPPGIVWLSLASQYILEAIGQPGLAPSIAALRLLSVIVNLVNIVLVGLTARKLAGDLAGLVAALAWATAPLVLFNAIYAGPDPYVYFLSGLALWLATVALLEERHRSWCVSSVAAGTLAVLFKYPVLTTIAPGLMVALTVFWRDRRRGLRYLILQAIIVGSAAFYVFFIYGFQHLDVGEAAVARSQGLGNMLQPARLLNNLYYTIYPISFPAFAIACLLGIAAYLLARQKGWKHIPLGGIGIIVFFLITIPWLATTFSLVNEHVRMRDVLPATVAACILLGAAVGQISLVLNKLTEMKTALFHLVAPKLPALLMLTVVFIPLFIQPISWVRANLLPDRRVSIRQWADMNLDPGTFLVDAANEKVFNPFWSGLVGHKWFDWWITPELTEHSLSEWRYQRWMTYALVSPEQLATMQKSEEGRTYLSQMLHLRDFTAPAMRGSPEIAYRLWRMQVETHFLFDNQIVLTGYDRNSDTFAPDDTIHLRFYWQALKQPVSNYSVFVHLVPLSGATPLSQADGAPSVHDRPTLTWDDPNETLISAPHSIKIPPQIPLGQYRLLVGLYDYTTGQRLSISDGTDSLELMTITVKQPMTF